MAKASFTKEDQVRHLSEKWHVDQDRARQMLRDVNNMFSDALNRKERVYLDDIGTLHVRIKPRRYKKVPGHVNKQVILPRADVVFRESETLQDKLKESYSQELKQADWE